MVSSLNERSVKAVSWGITFLGFDILRLRRKVVLQNLRIAFKDQPIQKLEKIGRRSIYNFVLTFMELLRSKRHDISQDIEIHGEEHLKAALEKNQGAYCLCFHMGNWEAMCSIMSRKITPSHVIVKKVGGDGTNKFVEELRTHNNFNWIRRRKGKKGDGVRQIKSVLGKNEVVGFVIDQARPGEPKLSFFGKPAKTNTSFAAIWQKAPAPIIPAFIRRKSLGKHEFQILPEITMQETDDPKKDIIDNSLMFNSIVEKIVSQYPEHYFWMHNRWKD